VNKHFPSFIRQRIGRESQKEFAARLGISAPQLCKVLKGARCDQDTIARIITGISPNAKVRAECCACLLRDLAALAGSSAVRISVRVR
jgi:predicted transcriptional regulator